MNAEQVAQIAHEVNRAFCISINDVSVPHWLGSPTWQRDAMVALVEAQIADYDEGHGSSPSDLHNARYRKRLADGWTYGPVSNPEKKEHPFMVEFCSLPVEQRMKGYLFNGIVKAFWDCERIEKK